MKFIISILGMTSLLCSSFLCPAQQLEYFSNHDDINEIFFEEDKMWVATNGGLLELDLDGKLIKKHTILDGISGPNVEHVFRKEDNTLCIKAGNSYADNLQVYKEGCWVDQKEFRKNKYISTITSNGLFGYVNHSDNEVVLYKKGEAQEYKMNVEGRSMNSLAIIDNENNLWVSYKNGVVKHDGNESKVYAFMDQYDSPKLLLKDKHGDLWANDILESWYHYDQKTDTWSICESDSCEGIKSSAFAFSDSKQNIWFADSRGSVLYKFDGTNWERIDIPFRDLSQRFSSRDLKDWLACGAEDKVGNLWFGTAYGNLYKYDGSEWTFIDLSEESNYFIDGKMDISTIHQAKNGTFWIAGWDYLKSFDIDEKNIQSFSKADLKKDSKARFPYVVLAMSSLIEDGSENIYINPQQGVFKYDKKLSKWKFFMKDRSIEFMYYQEQSRNTYFLSDNGLLIGETDDGVVTFRHIIQTDSNGYVDYDFMHVDAVGNLWVKANDTLHYITKDSSLIFDSFNSPITEDTDFIYEDSKGRVWADIEGGIAYWDRKKWVSFTKRNSPIRSVYKQYGQSKCFPITEGQNGNIYIESNESIFKWNGKKWKTNRKWNACLRKESSYTSLFFDSKNNLWIIDRKAGVFKCQGKNCEPILHKFSTNPSQVLEDEEGRIWLLTKGGGLFRYTN